MGNQLLRLSWLAICIFYLTLRIGAQGVINEEDIELVHDEEKTDRVSANPPHIIRRQESPAVSEALKILRPLQPNNTPESSSKSRGLYNTVFYYAKEIFFLLFMNNVPSSPSKPTRLSTPLLQATTILQTAASSQDPDAIFLLAEMNFFGNYTYPRNYTEAFMRYHELSSLNGNNSAQHMLGFMYATGYGGAVERDQAKATMYHTFAAKGGNTKSEMTLAYRHLTGIATPRNCNKAAYWYKNVADKSVLFSRSGPAGGQALQRDAYKIADEIGGVYGEGASVVSSGVNANKAGPNSDAHAAFDDVLEYLDLMSRKGDLKATFSLGRLHYEGSRTMKRNLRTARAYFMTVARKYWQRDGSIREEDDNVAKIASKAAGYLGRIYLRGEGTEVSYEKALTWFRRGVKSGDALCQYQLGVMYLYGMGVRQDPLLAGDYFRASAEQDFASAQINMAKLFLDQGNIPEATRYFDLAARHGHIEAYYALGDMNDKGIGREKSCYMATAFYKMVVEKVEPLHSAFDEANAAFNAGDIETALPIYMMAAEQGYESAQANVAYILDDHKSIIHLSRLLPWSRPSTTIKNAVLALIYWTRSAKQSNIDSLVKMGDYYLNGAGVNADMEKAAQCYQTAAETHQSAQALWNLGWIHENGVGVHQDFHLAKRFYDQALDTNQESYLPVKLALIKLRVRSAWNRWRGEGNVRSIKEEKDTKADPPQTWSEFFHSFLDDPHPYYLDNADDDAYLPIADDDNIPIVGGDLGDLGADPTGLGGDLLDGNYDDLDETLIESAIILILMAVLAWLVWYRNQRLAGHRREMERTGNDGSNTIANGQVVDGSSGQSIQNQAGPSSQGQLSQFINERNQATRQLPQGQIQEQQALQNQVQQQQVLQHQLVQEQLGLYAGSASQADIIPGSTLSQTPLPATSPASSSAHATQRQQQQDPDPARENEGKNEKSEQPPHENGDVEHAGDGKLPNWGSGVNGAA